MNHSIQSKIDNAVRLNQRRAAITDPDLRALADATVAVGFAYLAQRRAVHAARRKGLAWQVIGEAMNVSRQSVADSHGEPLDEEQP